MCHKELCDESVGGLSYLQVELFDRPEYDSRKSAIVERMRMFLPLEYSNCSVIKRIATVGSSALVLKHQEGSSQLTKLLGHPQHERTRVIVGPAFQAASWQRRK